MNKTNHKERKKHKAIEPQKTLDISSLLTFANFANFAVYKP
jgi:hypothetical protein